MKAEIMLSICIGTYNRCDILLKNVNKLLEYKGNDIEIVIVDNASDDETWKALQTITDKRVSVFRNDVNKGATFNWLRAIMLGQGKYRMNLNDRDSIDIKKLSAFLEFLYNSENIGDVIISMDGVKPVSNAWERSYSWVKNSHPSNYIYSAKVLDKQYSLLDKEVLEGTKEFDISKYNLSLSRQIAIFEVDNWYSYPEQIAVLMQPGEKKKIQQQRFDPIHGDPWGAPEVRRNHLEDQTYICSELKKHELWKGFYRADLEIILEIYYAENKQKSFAYWMKVPALFAKESKKILVKYDMWNKCKYDLLFETFSGYRLLLWQLSYRFYRKYIVRGSEYWN